MAGDTPTPCSFDPELWYSGLKEDIDRAQLICETLCPFQPQCLELARHYEKTTPTKYCYGVWGGLLPSERKHK